MKIIHTLKRALKQVPDAFSCYQVDLICRLMGALIQTRSVNLKRLAAALSGSAQIDSHYRRLQRFFSSDLSPQVFTQLIAQRLVRPGKPLFLTLDRTHWRYGQTHQNLLCLGLLHKRVSIPLETCSLGKAGNSSTRERKQLLKKALSYLPIAQCCLLADREFISREWFQFLLRQRLDFVIRLRSNHWIKKTNGDHMHLEYSTRRQKKNTTRIYANALLYGRVHLHIVCHRPAQGTRLFLVTNRDDVHQAVTLYKQRWSIETAFGFLKSKGFDLETTRLMQPERMQRLMGVLSLCLLWGLLVGDHLQQRKATPIKKHGQRAISLFRRGLDYLQHLLANAKEKHEQLQYATRLLVSCS